MTDLQISTAAFLEEVKKVVLEWDITITPDDFMENSEKYTEVKITVVNQKNKITREAKIPLKFPYKTPSNLTLMFHNIASLVCRETQKNDLELSQKIGDHFSNFFDNKS